MLVLYTNNVSEYCMINLHLTVTDANVRGWGTHHPTINPMMDADIDYC